MKHLINLVVIIGLALLLIGCGTHTESDHSEDTDDNTHAPVNKHKAHTTDQEAHLLEREKDEVDHTEKDDFGNDNASAENQSTSTNTEESTTKSGDTYENNVLDQLTEGATFKNTINIEDIQVDIVEDNHYKRVMLIGNKDGHKTHKSIFLKKKNRLKIIEFDKGKIFNQVI